jgi:glucose-1-phosphate adenylyltransferase
VLARSVQVDATSNLQESVLLPDVRIGRDVKLRRVIVESGCRIPDGLIVGEDADEDARRFYRTINGVVLINNSMLTRLST